MLARVEESAVDLVGQDDDVALAGDVGNGFQVGAGEHAAGRVVGRVDDDQPGLAGDQRAELVGVEAKAAFFAERHGHGGGADEADHALVDRKAGVGIEDLVARVDQGQDREEHDRLTARGDHHVRRVDVQAAPAFQVARDRLAQLGQAAPGP